MRRRRQKRAIAAQKVSIHASVKDATRRDSRVAFHLPSFNPRICKRCDRRDPRVAFHLPGFNPRICKRCDFAQSRLYHYRRVSIHASVKDATIKISAYPFRAYVSIHASVKDATCKGVNFFTSPYCFNPRICKRCDVSNCFSSLFLSCFNPRICKRCDREP